MLLTTPYDPHAGQAAVGQIIELAARVQQQRAIAAKQQAEQFAADQRRAFEFDRKMEFDRARTAADDHRADDKLAWEKQTWNAENAPLPTLSTGAAATPSYSVPAVSGGTSDSLPSTDTSTPTLSTDLPNPDDEDAGPNSTPPMDRPGDDGSDTPMTADDAVAEHLLPALPAGAQIQGRDANGAPIVSDQPDFGRSVVSQFGGSLFPPGNIPRVAKPSPGSPVPTIEPPSPAAAAANSLAEMQARGIPVTAKTARVAQAAAVAAAVRGAVSTTKAATDRPITRQFPDGSLKQYNPATKDWDTLGEKPKGASVDELTNGMEFNQAHNTYKNADGAEYFVGVVNGKPSLRPFRPDAHPAKRTWGSDGNVYYFDAQGNPLKPIPDGVELRDTSRMQTAHVPGDGLYLVHPDGTQTMMIPDGVLPTAKMRDSYKEDVELAAVAKDELEKEKKALAEKGSKHDWFGASAESVDKKQADYDKLKATVERTQQQYPRLRPQGAAAAPAAPAAGPASYASPIEVKQALRDGKLDRSTAEQILRSKFGFGG